MSEQFDQALRVVVAVGTTWGPLADRVGEARSALTQIAAALTDLGEPGDADLERLQRQLDRLGNAVATDPITVEARDFDTLETELERLRGTLDAAMQLREEIVERVAQARSTANKLRSSGVGGRRGTPRGAAEDRLAGGAGAVGRRPRHR